MFFSDVVNQFLDQHGLANAGTTEEANFSALAIGSKEVDHLDAGFKDLGLRFQFSQFGS